MRTSTFARAGAVITASALAFSLGTAPVSAAETTTTAVSAGSAPVSATAQAFTPGSIEAAGIPTSAIHFSSGVIADAETTRYYGAGTFTTEDLTSATVFVNGRAKGAVPLLYSATPGDNAIALDIPRAWGSGKIQVNISGATSNVFYARKPIKTGRSDGLFFEIRHRGNNVKLSARSIKILNPRNGTYVGLRKIKVQQKKNGKWRTLKTIKMNTKGSGSVTYKTRKKYQYRLKSAKSTTQIAFQSENSRKI